MADISKIVTPDGSEYNLKDALKKGVYTVIGTQTAQTAAWTGNIDVPALYDGLTIAYYLPYKSKENASLNLTLSNGTKTGAVACYIGTSRISTHYSVGSTIILTYYGAGSVSVGGTPTSAARWSAGDYDSNSWRNIQVNGTELLGTATSSGALNLKSGTNVTVSGSGNDVTIDTTIPDAAAVSYDNTSSGLTATDVQAALDEIIVLNKNAGYHNSIYRGKNLGNAVTEAQYTAINTGTFEDMYIGDYWVIHDDLTNKDITWRIAHFDYWLNCGDTNTTTHHIVIIPDTILYSAKMNETNTTEGGYLHSKMRGGITYTDFSQGNLAQAKTIIETAFGSAHILSHRELLSSASDSSGATAWTWADSTVDLISEVMAYGCKVWANSDYDVGIDKEQLALFRHDHSRIVNRSHQWLRSVSSSAAFASVHYIGHASDSIASYSGGVRPAFALCS